MVTGHLGIGPRRQRKQARALGPIVGYEWLPDNRLEIALQFLQRPGPAVALVLHEPLQHGERRWLDAVREVFNGAGKGWQSIELPLFGEEPADLTVGVRPRFLAPEQLENQMIPVANGGVALLDGANGGRECIGAVQLGEPTTGGCTHHAVAHRELPLAGDPSEECRAGRVVGGAILQHAGAARRHDAREHAGRRHVAQSVRYDRQW